MKKTSRWSVPRAYGMQTVVNLKLTLLIGNLFILYDCCMYSNPNYKISIDLPGVLV